VGDIEPNQPLRWRTNQSTTVTLHYSTCKSPILSWKRCTHCSSIQEASDMLAVEPPKHYLRPPRRSIGAHGGQPILKLPYRPDSHSTSSCTCLQLAQPSSYLQYRLSASPRVHSARFAQQALATSVNKAYHSCFSTDTTSSGGTCRTAPKSCSWCRHRDRSAVIVVTQRQWLMSILTFARLCYLDGRK